jgi:ERCC4-type nuclease
MQQTHGADTRPTIIVDTREQTPWVFSPSVITTRATLAFGDYSVLGLEGRVAIERKSVADLCGSLTAGRLRFFRELEKLADYEFAAVFVEGDLPALMRGEYRSEASPQSIIGSCAAIAVDVGVHVCFLGSRAAASAYAEKVLCRLAALDSARESVKRIVTKTKTETRKATGNGTGLQGSSGSGPS